MKVETQNTETEMQSFQNFQLGQLLTAVGSSVAALFNDKGLLTVALAASGFVQVILYNSQITLDLFYATFLAFFVMTLLGVVKHFKEGKPNGKVFLIKTLIQAGLMIGVILLGFSATIVFNVFVGVLGTFMKESPIQSGASMYFTYSAFMIMFTYYFIKSVDLADQISPNIIPGWFSAPFRKYRKTGKVTDLLDTNPEKDDQSEDI